MTSQTRWLTIVAFGAFLGFCLPSGAYAQAPGGGSDKGGDKGGGSMDFRQRMQDKMKELMAATDEEWAVLQPRIERVQTLQRNISIGRSGMAMLFGGGGSRGGAPGADPAAGGGSTRDPNGGGSGRDRTSGRGGFSGFTRGGTPGATGGAPGGGSTTPAAPVEEKAKDLQISVENKDAAAKEVAAKLAALREERAKAKAELERAQDDLRSLLTVKQEAVLVVVGVLDP
jgi:hypothetical protein